MSLAILTVINFGGQLTVDLTYLAGIEDKLQLFVGVSRDDDEHPVLVIQFQHGIKRLHIELGQYSSKGIFGVEFSVFKIGVLHFKGFVGIGVSGGGWYPTVDSSVVVSVQFFIDIEVLEKPIVRFSTPLFSFDLQPLLSSLTN